MDRDPPLIVGRIHGVRTWSLMWVADGGLALAGYGGIPWEPGGRPTRAGCANGGRACRRAPSSGCACGLYARHPFADEARRLRFGPPDPTDEVSRFNDLDVGGVVEAWGRVELHRGGFRAQYGRPIALAVLDGWRDSEYAALVRGLATRYCAEVVCVRDPGELVAWCERHGLGLAEPTVRSLLRDRSGAAAQPAEPATAPAEDTGRAGWLSELWREWRPDGIVDALGFLFGGTISVLYAAFWVVVAYVIAGAIFGWLPEDPVGGKHPVLRGERSLKVLDQELVREGKRRWLYLATVRNTGGRAALGVVPTGRLLDRDGDRIASIGPPGDVEGAANLAPRQTGVVWDVIRPRAPGRRATSDVARMKVGAGARRLVAGPKRPPVEVRRVRANRDLCIVTAVIESRRRMDSARLALVGRGPSGRALGAATTRVGPLSRGPDRYFVTGIPPRVCRHPGVGLEVNASLTRQQLLTTPGDRSIE